MPRFEQSVDLPVSAEAAFQWHESPGALERLTPPWEPVSVEEKTGGIKNGDRVVLKLKVGPVPLRWVAEHSGYDPPKKFEDTQLSGPFAKWHHVHAFTELDQRRSRLSDQIEYELPLGFLGRLFGGGMTENKLDAMFAYRHRVTRDDLMFHATHSQSPQKIAVVGASGLVGSTLCPLLTTGGHEVVKLTRSTPDEPNERQWNPSEGKLDASAISDCDAVIHLAGESIMGRWTDEKKQRIRDSRVNSTRLIADTMAKIENGPKTLVVASAIGFYGDRGDEQLTEDSAPADDFLAEVSKEWEAAADAAREAGIRVVHVRLGIVISSAGGALANMITPFKLGLGGPVGSGDQYWSWIAIDDAAAIFAWAALDDTVSGVVNATAPKPATNREFTKTLAEVINRPAFIPVPKFGVGLAFGEMGHALLLASARVLPERTQSLGYKFRFTDLDDALRHELGKP